VARRQHGLLTTRQLRACGLTPSMIHAWAHNGSLHRIHHGVYAVGHDALSREARWMAAVLAVGDDAALARFAAAVHWGMWRRSIPGWIDVVAPRSRVALDGVRTHASRTLICRDIARRAGLRVTTPARTILDLGDELTPWTLTNVIHEGAFRRRITRRAIEDQLRRNRGRQAVTVLRHAWELHLSGSAGTKSDFEDQVLAALLAGGVPEPRVNIDVAVAAGEQLQVDFVWPKGWLALEADGGGHGRMRTRAEDRERERKLRAAGWEVLRCTPDDYRVRVREIARLLEA
jgi:hypothetical protein